MIVKNEFDIIRSVLSAAEEWANKIYIVDNGSTDGTWEAILSMAFTSADSNEVGY